MFIQFYESGFCVSNNLEITKKFKKRAEFEIIFIDEISIIFKFEGDNLYLMYDKFYFTSTRIKSMASVFNIHKNKITFNNKFISDKLNSLSLNDTEQKCNILKMGTCDLLDKLKNDDF